MRLKLNAFAAAGLAAAIMAIAISAASANRLSVNADRVYLIWTTVSPLEFTAPFAEPVRCGVTLLGSFHRRTITKVAELLAGHITHARLSFGACTGGEATVNEASLPWSVRYKSFTGRLPLISAVQVALVGARFRISNNLGTCNATTTAAEPARGSIVTNAEGRATGVVPSGSIDLEGEEEICDLFGANGVFAGPQGRVAAEEEGGPAPIVRLI